MPRPNDRDSDYVFPEVADGLPSVPTPKRWHVVEAFNIPIELAASKDGVDDRSDPDCERAQTIMKYIKTSEGKPFEKNQFAYKAEISLLEQLAVGVFFMVIVGGPLLSFATVIWGIYGLLFHGYWLRLVKIAILWVALANHPIPIKKQKIWTSWFARALYRYFSYRLCWTDECLEELRKTRPWIGCGSPHGVVPMANILCMMALNSFTFCGVFTAGPASVVPVTPFLRYMTALGPCLSGVSSKHLQEAAKRGESIGIVPDGIAGIFQQNNVDETVYLKDRKGLAKFALRTGVTLLPAYSMGNTRVFSAWFDRWGILEKLSRKIQASVFLYWGRFGLPIPYRTNISIVVHNPIVTKRVENPTQEQIDEVHLKLLAGMKACFDLHKDALGWSERRLKFI